ncbi:translation initiation factor IF-2 isoform X4 [Schistocerca piceifrons]|uniref:translation initiation factor IF-2 isoform X4 n=1 Tax=Schistocerca piceifrons TaxID=274613 RepID=UPI001F5F0533|nr:translation initiation factor IF-2 isoform X4 [Schistocerca piceifrons]
MDPWLCAAALVTAVALWLWLRPRTQMSPPGPRGLPLLGNLLLLDAAAPHESLSALARRYGPIFSLRLGSVPTVVLADARLVRDAFAKDACTGRAPLYLTHGIMKGKEAGGRDGGPAVGAAALGGQRDERARVRPHLRGGRPGVALAAAPAGGGHQAHRRRRAAQLPALPQVPAAAAAQRALPGGGPAADARAVLAAGGGPRGGRGGPAGRLPGRGRAPPPRRPARTPLLLGRAAQLPHGRHVRSRPRHHAHHSALVPAHDGRAPRRAGAGVGGAARAGPAALPGGLRVAAAARGGHPGDAAHPHRRARRHPPRRPPGYDAGRLPRAEGHHGAAVVVGHPHGPQGVARARAIQPFPLPGRRRPRSAPRQLHTFPDSIVVRERRKHVGFEELENRRRYTIISCQ